MRVCLVNPGINPCEYPVKTTPPFGLLCVAAFLREAGYECSVIDLGGRDVTTGELRSLLNHEAADVVGVSVVAGPFISRAVSLSRVAREQGATVVWGGHFPTLFPDLSANHDACDFAVRGEGEVTLLELLRALEDEDDVADIPGLTFAKYGQAISTPDRPFIPDIDVLPQPAWDLLDDLERYVVDFYGRRGFPLVTSRGCPFRCAFCYINPMWKRKWRPRSAPKILEEIRFVQSLVPDIEAVIFAEDIFAINRHRVEDFGRALKEESLSLDWYCDIRADMMKEAVLRRMHDAGCRHVYVGVETGSPRLLRKTVKDVTREQILDGFQAAGKVGLNTTAIFMFGIPGETREDIEATARLAKQIKATRYEFVVYVPYPGTPLFPEAVRWGFLPPKTVEGWADIGLIEDFDRLRGTNLTMLDAEETIRRVERLRREVWLRGLFQRGVKAFWSLVGTT